MVHISSQRLDWLPCLFKLRKGLCAKSEKAFLLEDRRFVRMKDFHLDSATT